MTTVDLICDLQYGSTGKGLFAGYIGHNNDYTAVVSANMPNAGHTFIDGDSKWVFKAIPIASVVPNVEAIFIGPGSVFDLAQLMRELDTIPNSEYKAIYIHEGAAILNLSHIDIEQNSLNHIASTMQGSMAAMVDKMARNDIMDVRVKNMELYTEEFDIRVVNQRDYHRAMSTHKSILVEGSQGYSLGINAGFWPFCTSRDCTPGRILADCGVPVQWLRHTYGTLRTFPIRVGNTEGGSSGPMYVDQEELSWEDIGQKPEMTTVTGRVRRVFSFSWKQYEEAWAECRPNFIFLNFVNYLDIIENDAHPFVKRVAALHQQWGGFYNVYLGNGPDIRDVTIL